MSNNEKTETEETKNFTIELEKLMKKYNITLERQCTYEDPNILEYYFIGDGISLDIDDLVERSVWDGDIYLHKLKQY